MNPQVFTIWGFFIFNMEHKKTTTKKVMVFMEPAEGLEPTTC